MRLLPAVVLLCSLVAAGQGCAQQPTSSVSVQFKAQNRENPTEVIEGLDFWSFYDHSDQVQVLVDFGREVGEVRLFTEVTVGAARIVWESEAKEVPDYEATIGNAYWLPALETMQLDVDARASREGIIAAEVRPDDILAGLRAVDPEILITALYVRACYVGRGGDLDGITNCASKEIPLYMAH